MAQMARVGPALSLSQQGSQAEKAVKSFDTQHRDLIHDAQLDYYGKLLATASSDCLIKIFEVTDNGQRHITDLIGHEGPVWRVSWAHPPFGQILASCGYDRRVIIWKLDKNSQEFKKWYMDSEFSHSVNCIEFGPYELGLILAVGCADGTISIYQFNNQRKSFIKSDSFNAHSGGVNSISWSNQVSTIMTNNNNNNNNNNNKNNKNMRFVSGGCDSVSKIWTFNYATNKFECESILDKGHSDWVRDVAWSPIPGSSSHGIVATCGEDKQVIIWKEKNGKWNKSECLNFDHKIWSVSWSELGNILGIAQSENTIQLFKEGLDGKWRDISKINN